jgi:hypothetical protein
MINDNKPSNGQLVLLDSGREDDEEDVEAEDDDR